jgi:hypothetical protein
MKLFESEDSKEVIEKVLECIRDLADEMGPGGVVTNMELIMGHLTELLAKESHCQTAKGGNDMEDYDEEGNNGEDSESDEDLDHDEIILGNTTDVIISIAKAMGNSFAPYLARLAPHLVTYVSD